MKKYRGTIAVVDDDHSVSHAIKRLLTAAGFRARSFGSAEALLLDHSAHTCDCLVLDIHLPGMSGLELQRRLHESGMLLPVVFISAHDDPRHAQIARTSGAAAFLTKPFSSLSLIDAVVTASMLHLP